MSANWNFASYMALVVGAFLIGHVSERVLYNIIVLALGGFLLLIANGMVAALKDSNVEDAKEHQQ